MKKLLTSLLFVLTVTAVCAQARKTDTFTTKSGKTVTITCIKHASLEINYNGTEIQVDPVHDMVKPITNYYDFPKANIILITHQHQDHFDREAIAAIRTNATAIYEPMSVYNLWFNGVAMANGDKLTYADGHPINVALMLEQARSYYGLFLEMATDNGDEPDEETQEMIQSARQYLEQAQE